MFGNNIDSQVTSPVAQIQKFNGVIELTDDVAKTVVGGKTTQVSQKGKKKSKSFLQNISTLPKVSRPKFNSSTEPSW